MPHTAYRTRAKIWEDALEIWYTSTDCSQEQSIPLADEAVPKEWIAGPEDVEFSIYPPFPADSGSRRAAWCFGPRLVGARFPNPENPGWYVTASTREGIE
jgi:hypothetical protein